MGELEQYGIRFVFENYRASNGVGVTLLCLTNDDEISAINAFVEELARSVRVVQHGVKKDSQGKVIGDRAEILISQKSGPPLHAVIWTSGPTFHEIRSTSLKHALEFENIY